jgi:hypothetical protein
VPTLSRLCTASITRAPVPPRHRSGRGLRCRQPTPAPPQFDLDAADPRLLAAVVASWGGKEHAAPNSPPPFPLHERGFLAAV